ncbi:hypothetical protein V6Z12_D06G097700 [Gossypium hirsutum]
MAAFEATKEAIWLRKFLTNFEVIHSMKKAITLYYDNSVTIANIKETRNLKKTNHINKKYHIIREAVADEIMDVVKVTSVDNLADSFTKTLLAWSFDNHVESMGIRNMTHQLH